MDPDVTWVSGRGCPLVVHYWADLQSELHVHQYSNCDIVAKLIYIKPRSCIQIYVLHQMSTVSTI